MATNAAGSSCGQGAEAGLLSCDTQARAGAGKMHSAATPGPWAPQRGCWEEDETCHNGPWGRRPSRQTAAVWKGRDTKFTCAKATCVPTTVLPSARLHERVQTSLMHAQGHAWQSAWEAPAAYTHGSHGQGKVPPAVGAPLSQCGGPAPQHSSRCACVQSGA